MTFLINEFIILARLELKAFRNFCAGCREDTGATRKQRGSDIQFELKKDDFPALTSRNKVRYIVIGWCG